MSRDRVVGGHPNHTFGISDPNLSIHCGATTTIKGSLHGSTPIVKRFSAENFVPSKAVPKMAIFRELRGVNVKFRFSNPEKAHSCAEPRHLTITRDNLFRGLGCGPVGRTREKS